MSEYERVQPIHPAATRRDPNGPVTEEQHKQLIELGFLAAGDGDYLKRGPPQRWVWAPDPEKNEMDYGAELAVNDWAVGGGGVLLRFDDPVVAAVYLLTLG